MSIIALEKAETPALGRADVLEAGFHGGNEVLHTASIFSEVTNQDYSFAVSVLTSTTGPLSKGFTLDAEGKLEKRPGGKLYAGRVEVMRFESLDDLAKAITTMTPVQALTYGRPKHDKARIVRREDLEAAKPHGSDLPVISRTRETFFFPDAPSVMMLDYDTPRDATEPMGQEALLDALYATMPGLKSSPHLVLPSASAFIFNTASTLRLDTSYGLRVLVVVQDGTDIPRAGEMLFKRLVLAGHGRIEVSRAGRLLPKTLIDGAVFQPERLDFIAGAACKAPLEQRRPPSLVLNAGAVPLDTRAALPSLGQSEEDAYRQAIDCLRRDAEPEARRIRDAYATARAKEQAGHDEGLEFEQAKRVFMKAVTERLLLGDYLIKLADGEVVTVGRLLDNVNRFHGRRCHDPLKPEYGGDDERIGYINLRRTGSAAIYSHAHGGQSFRLCRALETIKVQPGERVEAVERVLELFRLQGDVYQRKDAMVRVDDAGRIRTLDLPALRYQLDARIRWVKFSKRDKANVPTDAPKEVAEGLLARAGEWGLPELVSVSTAPILLPQTGELLQEEGFHAGSGILVLNPASASWPSIKTAPTLEDVREALARLWKPWAEFPLCGPVDRGVLLTTILAAVVRPALPTCPVTLIEAHTAGTGKTLCTSAIGALLGGEMPVQPLGKDEEERRKKLLAIGLRAAPAVCFDNIVGVLESASLCAFTTSPTYGDRELGASRERTVPTRTLILLNGNNVAIKGDLCRRVLRCRMDAGVEKPYRRGGFALDPVAYVQEHRHSLVADALTILRYYYGRPHPEDDRTASYELWSDTIRKAVILVGRDGVLDVQDPVTSLDAAYEEDPDTTRLRGLIHPWYSIHGETFVTLADVQRSTDSFDDPADNIREQHSVELRSAMDACAGDGHRLNLRILGGWMRTHRGRIVDGLCFEQGKQRGGVATWRVRSA